MTAAKLEARIAALESEVAKLRAQIHASPEGPRPWWERVAGTVPDDEMTRRAERQGRAYRKSTKPKPGKGKRKRAHSRHGSRQPAAAA